MIRRFRRLATGDFGVFAEIADDTKATREAAIIAAVTFAVLAWALEQTTQAVVLGLVLGIVGLVGWTGVLWATGRILGGRARPAHLFRGLGYVAPPLALAAVPLLGVAAGVGSVALQIVAMKRIGGLTAGRALLATTVPWIGVVLFGAAVRSVS